MRKYFPGFQLICPQKCPLHPTPRVYTNYSEKHSPAPSRPDRAGGGGRRLDPDPARRGAASVPACDADPALGGCGGLGAEGLQPQRLLPPVTPRTHWPGRRRRECRARRGPAPSGGARPTTRAALRPLLAVRRSPASRVPFRSAPPPAPGGRRRPASGSVCGRRPPLPSGAARPRPQVPSLARSGARPPVGPSTRGPHGSPNPTRALPAWVRRGPQTPPWPGSPSPPPRSSSPRGGNNNYLQR